MTTCIRLLLNALVFVLSTTVVKSDARDRIRAACAGNTGVAFYDGNTLIESYDSLIRGTKPHDDGWYKECTALVEKVRHMLVNRYITTESADKEVVEGVTVYKHLVPWDRSATRFESNQPLPHECPGKIPMKDDSAGSLSAGSAKPPAAPKRLYRMDTTRDVDALATKIIQERKEKLRRAGKTDHDNKRDIQREVVIEERELQRNEKDRDVNSAAARFIMRGRAVITEAIATIDYKAQAYIDHVTNKKGDQSE